jgi:hypothetical protein
MQGEPAERVADRMWRWAEQDPTQRLRRRVRHGYTWPSLFRERIEPLIDRVAASGQGAGGRE